MTNTANKRWQRLNNAMEHYQDFIKAKASRHQLSVEDLIHISNFKGGNASITEPKQALQQKLPAYESIMRQLHQRFAGKTLKSLHAAELQQLITLCEEMLALTQKPETEISGFGPSYCSALLAAHFLDLIPILDRRILNGAGIKVAYNSSKQVKNMQQHYPALITRCHQQLQNSDRTLRQLDLLWFQQPMPWDLEPQQ
ncbi:hypothetical protein [uncultured Ferrimonas sp.]|uniref:hypothetical protein n=1 Tax=uncultured Ferrimonas sp. TaxID=432640 RepID=UPI00262DF244|nr:hypothetical protein [uncultured Ferrimonas sp.]